VIVNAMQHSPWATATVFATIPIAILIGCICAAFVPAA
jgi:carbon starvation protein